MGRHRSLAETARGPRLHQSGKVKLSRADRAAEALALLVRPIAESERAALVAVPISPAREALAEMVAHAVVVVEEEALASLVALAAAEATDTSQSLFSDMKVVKVDREARTYEGPWDWSDESVPSGDYLKLADATAQGFTLAPPPPALVPERVPKWAFLLILRRMGKEAALQAAIAGYTGPNADRVRAKWEADPDIERDGQTVDDLGKAVGLTPAQVDQVFRDAEKEANQ